MLRMLLHASKLLGGDFTLLALLRGRPIDVLFSGLCAFLAVSALYETVYKGKFRPGPIKSQETPIRAPWYIRSFVLILAIALLWLSGAFLVSFLQGHPF